jgi:hypothetical protein
MAAIETHMLLLNENSLNILMVVNMSWIFLILGVAAEAMSHLALKETEGFTKPLPRAFVLLGHLAAFMFLGQAMKGSASHDQLFKRAQSLVS